ncbi:hypothetical protein BDP27DRAFT_1349030 [Rhodocollybia butyracea]|uniref:Uncharacterized protein n=1 Tax=Rhodocollybia butyracea TaxID=206335 RepID=A0A9P5P5F0_9AGAR|nr:hypothetical protein BDP27DRAFT_1349030 [Rhodocollybia butyracea]
MLATSRTSPNKLHQLRAFSVQQGTNFHLHMKPDHSGKTPILESLTHLDYGSIYPWGYPRFLTTSKAYPTNIALTVEKWLKLPGLKILVLRFCSDRDMDQFCSSISGEKQIADPRVVCLQMPSPIGDGDHFEFLSRVWALGEEVHNNKSMALKKL